jgi:hypothetical protein
LFIARVDAHLPSELIERVPSLWERLKQAWGGAPRASRARNQVEAVAFLYELRAVLDGLGIHSARSLVVDEQVVYHDPDNRAGDLPELFDALAEHAATFGQASQTLQLCVEHEQAGLHFILDGVVTAEHEVDAPSARLVVRAQLRELEHQPGESATSYRRRVEDLLEEKSASTTRAQFAMFMARLEDELRRRFVDARFVTTTEVQHAMAPVRLPVRAATQRAGADTAAPQRNFTLSAEQRINALVAGPPAYAVRLRRIEDLTAELLKTMREAERKSATHVPVTVVRSLERLNKLISDHNRYFPVEANLAVDPTSGDYLLLGKAWRPTPNVTIDDLRRQAGAEDLR